MIGRNEIVASFPAARRSTGLGLPLTTAARPGVRGGGLGRLVEGGVAVLVFEGEIVNRPKERHVPPIRVILLDDGGRQLQHEIFQAQDASLDAGGKTTFSGRLVNPPSQARNYSVTFDLGS